MTHGTGGLVPVTPAGRLTRFSRTDAGSSKSVAVSKPVGDLAAVDRLMREYQTYDQAVDVVSAFEFLFTVPSDMRATVAHFERFPKIQTEHGTITPDFTVLFTDGTLLVGEIARLSLRPESVDSVCEQILRYDSLRRAPDASGRLVDVGVVDVLLFVPFDVGPDAVERIIGQRMAEPSHPYKPSKPPCVVQFGRDPDRYMFQRINDPLNGLVPDYDRDPGIGSRIRKINVPAGRLTAIKAESKFMNDPIPPLYLAVILYTQTWPTIFMGQRGDLIVLPSATASALQSQYGAGSTKDVKHALALLQSAGLAVDNGDKTWTVAPRPRMRGEHDLAQIIAQKSATHASPVVRKPRTRDPKATDQPTLFDELG